MFPVSNLDTDNRGIIHNNNSRIHNKCFRVFSIFLLLFFFFLLLPSINSILASPIYCRAINASDVERGFFCYVNRPSAYAIPNPCRCPVLRLSLLSCRIGKLWSRFETVYRGNWFSPKTGVNQTSWAFQLHGAIKRNQANIIYIYICRCTLENRLPAK